MSRIASGLASLILVGALGFSTPARADDPPPLTPPAGQAPLLGPSSGENSRPLAPIPAPNAPSTPPPARPAPRRERPMLALPGVTLPPSRPARAPLPLPESGSMPSSLAPSADGGLPPLVSPGTLRPSLGTGPSAGPALPPSPASRFRGRVIDSVPADTTSSLPAIVVPPGDPRPVDRIELDELGGPASSRSIPTGPTDPRKADETLSRMAPSRRPGLLGGMLNNPFGPRGTPPGGESTIRAEPRSDPAADAIIKRRIEKQAREAVGDRVKELDVRVVGRSIAIHAHGTKFLQRRPVRKALENLPGLSGYRSTIDVRD